MTDKTMQELTNEECETVAGGVSFKRPPLLTTMAVGEEDGCFFGGPIYTTLALGEEDKGELTAAPLDIKLHR